MRALPTELVESVIDSASTHPPTLAACSLVCKKWLPRSRHHLFSSTDLSAYWNPEPNAVTEFLCLIESPKATLIPFVITVVLEKRSWGMTPIRNILARLARSGIRPKFLHINCPVYEPTISPDCPPVFFMSLTRLTLHLHNDMAMATLVDYVCAFPLLEYFYVGGSATYTTQVRPFAKALPPRLHTLGITNPVFVHWVLSLEPMPQQLRTTILRAIRLSEKWPAINRFLDSAAAIGVQSLIFEHCDTYPHSILPNLQSLGQLQHLTFEHDHSMLADCLLGVLGALRASPARNVVETIDLHIFSDGLTDLCIVNYGLRSRRREQWRANDEILADTKLFPRLRRVGVRTPGLYGMTTEIEEDLPLCRARGLLVVR
ncbi:hypothetical protein B0H10DRAFT_2021955 [Mycena sp. CBHHK59/15]|nr:hypothetical protein B0H10DRAFT_2021955 [Mycena sp. CBHHK59/15]